MSEAIHGKDVDNGLILGADGKYRCFWAGKNPDYIHYHDEEWGVPVTDDRRLFEKICLEGFQAGLSWYTILKKRDNFRAAFDNFDFEKIVHYNDEDVERLVKDEGIVRHRGKIRSVINNAHRALELVAEYGSLSAFFWSFEPTGEERFSKVDLATLMENPTTAVSQRLSKDLKKRGWTFVGPTTIYAFMQAMGLVNDHIEGCSCRDRLERR